MKEESKGSTIYDSFSQKGGCSIRCNSSATKIVDELSKCDDTSPSCINDKTKRCYSVLVLKQEQDGKKKKRSHEHEHEETQRILLTITSDSSDLRETSARIRQ
jgi:hypothetical protein